MAKSENGAGGDKATVTRSNGDAFTFSAAGQVNKNGGSTALAHIPAREMRYGNGDDKVYCQDANGGWMSYNGSAWVADRNPMGM